LRESRVERRERERREEARREAAHRERVRNRARELEREMEYEEALDRKYGREPARRKSKVGGVIALIIILLLAFTALRVWMEMRPGAVEPIVIAGSGEYETERINILFLGTNQGLSDTNIVFSMDSKNKRLDAISIPRDTYYNRPHISGAAFNKFNSIYQSEGYEAACRAASEILGGIPIHYYAEIDVKGAARVIDAMGGVTMYVPIDMQYTDVNQNLYIDLRAGTQHLNGEQAIHFARYRSSYANADLGRIAAQQELLKAIVSQSSGLDYARVAVVARAETRTNTNFISQAALAARATSIAGGSFNTYTIPGSTGTKDGLSFFFHDPTGTNELIRQIYNNN